jgi:serine/threonine-protein kinase RsbW
MGIWMAELSLQAGLDQLSTIRAFVGQVGCDLGLDERTIYALELAVDEACTNVIRHAYRGQGGEIRIRVEQMDDRVQVVIRDWGQAFDPQAIPLPDVTAPLEQRPLGGVGLFLMRQMMDSVEFEFSPNDGNKLTMTKRLHGRK